MADHLPIALITGGSRGIGAATARLAARQGWAVAVNYTRDADAAQAVVASITGAGGTASAGCLPRVEAVTVDGADLSIELGAAATGCRADRLVPFHLAADPASSPALRACSW